MRFWVLTALTMKNTHLGYNDLIFLEHVASICRVDRNLRAVKIRDEGRSPKKNTLENSTIKMSLLGI